MTQSQTANSKMSTAQIVPSLIAGAVSGLVVSIASISFASLIFNGDLYIFMPSGIGIMLFGSLFTGVLYIIFSSYKGSVNVLQGTAAALIGLEASSITADMWGVYSNEVIFLTVVAVVLFTTVLTGVFSYLLGMLKLGSLVRYLPYPVMGGFLAGSGWLLFVGGFNLTSTTPFGLDNLATLFSSAVLIRWLPALLFTLIMFFALRYIRHFLTMPILILSGFAIFFIVLSLSGVSLVEASDAGWFLGPFPDRPQFKFSTFATFANVPWGLILAHFLNVTSIILISIISFLLNVSGIDINMKEDIDINQELRTAGIVNVATGLFMGAQPSAPAVSLTLLGYRMRAFGPLAGVISAAVPALLLFFGAELLPFLPRSVMGAVLMYFGLGLMVEWLYDAFTKLPRFEYLIIWVIVVTMANIGQLEGVGLGLIVATLLFVINYARIDVVKHQLNGSSYRSTVDRPLVYQQRLGDQGSWLSILELQGYIFFGTASRIYQTVVERVNEDVEEDLRFIVIDFRQVVGMDASAVMEFKKILNLIEDSEIQVVFTNLSATLKNIFVKENYLSFSENDQRIFEDLDRGVEWCEDRQLDKYIESGLVGNRRDAVQKINVNEGGRNAGQLSALLDFLGEREKTTNIPMVSTLSEYLERFDYQPQDYIIKQGEYTQGLYFLEEGEATAYLENDDHQVIRLRKMSTGAVIGEVSYYHRSLASASVQADTNCEVYILSRANITEIDRNAPELSRELHRFMAQLLSYRLATSTNTIRALMG